MKVPIANVLFDNVTMAQAVDQIVAMSRKRDKARFVCTGNLDHLVMLDRDTEFADVYHCADLVLADGAPVVWLSRLYSGAGGQPIQERVAGSDLFWELAKASHEQGLTLFFLGGVPGVADRAREAVLARYPNAKICGTYCPPFETFKTEEEQARIRETVSAAAPDILMVAFGAPKQEKWIAANRDLIQVPVSIGVGGSFEMAAGQVRRAPVWMRRSGLEWMFRFIQEPGRLYQRYFVNDLPFLAKLIVRTLIARLARKPYRPSGGVSNREAA
ncbi:acetyl-mannosamine transferase [Capsulimonas corticalis]|uniref:Acetyl-mannosamine transferase n=1 Tax=Capsulimonas corticalis TaxID=2219043 RepID=A0A402D1Q3_9BACT|nr:WecB/TagA/CpsF family glycosyltransferase [Capsulimonas corticalis]BDI28715.1 acetyl-mannosamine transferase [Capsulimonas corticalis]